MEYFPELYKVRERRKLIIPAILAVIACYLSHDFSEAGIVFIFLGMLVSFFTGSCEAFIIVLVELLIFAILVFAGLFLLAKLSSSGEKRFQQVVTYNPETNILCCEYTHKSKTVNRVIKNHIEIYRITDYKVCFGKIKLTGQIRLFDTEGNCNDLDQFKLLGKFTNQARLVSLMEQKKQYGC